LKQFLDADHTQVLRIASYDPCPQPDAVMGIRSHVDHTLISGLVQDDTGGLQVQKDGRWHGVAPLPGAIVILMGAAIQVSDRCLSTFHLLPKVRFSQHGSIIKNPFDELNGGKYLSTKILTKMLKNNSKNNLGMHSRVKDKLFNVIYISSPKSYTVS